MTIKRETVIKWLFDWKENVEEDNMSECCKDQVLSELGQMIATVTSGFLEEKQKIERI